MTEPNELARLRHFVAQSMLAPQLRGVGMCIPKGVDRASIAAPEPTPIDAEVSSNQPDQPRPAA